MFRDAVEQWTKVLGLSVRTGNRELRKPHTIRGVRGQYDAATNHRVVDVDFKGGADVTNVGDVEGVFLRWACELCNGNTFFLIFLLKK